MLQPTNPRSSLLVGIGGGTGTGKSTAAREVCERYAAIGVALLDQDSYYLDRSHLSPEERSAVNFDEPAAIDHELLLAHALALLGGESVEKPQYDFSTHTRAVRTHTMRPGQLVVAEGLFAWWDPRLRDLMRLRVFLDADAGIRLIRRARRDLALRGRSLESVFRQYIETVRPMHQKYIEPAKADAHLVIDTSSESYAEMFVWIDRLLAGEPLPGRPPAG